MSGTNPVAGFGCEQTGKREWRAWVFYGGQRHWIGCRDHQADALKAAREVWRSLHGDWSGAGAGKQTLRELYGADFLPEAFTTDGQDEIIRGTHGDMRWREDWLLVRFQGFTSAELLAVEAELERDWYGSKKLQHGELSAVGIGRPFSVAMGRLIGAPMRKAVRQTEGLSKVASGARAVVGPRRDKIEARYLSMGEMRVPPMAAAGAGVVCGHCGSEMFRPRSRFCSDRCKKAAARVAA